MNVFPGAYLVQWCRSLPGGHGRHVAHLTLICTSSDMSPLFLEGDEIWRDFQAWLMKEDLPVRMAVRLASAVAAISFILGCLASGQARSMFPVPLGQAAPPPGEQLWPALAGSFEQLSQTLCGQEQVAAWLRQTLHGQA